MPAKTNKKKTKTRTKTFNVFTESYVNLMHNHMEAARAEFYLRCNHHDTDDNTYATIILANRAADAHRAQHPGHVVIVKVRQYSDD